ncbi:MAG: glycosyltransferase family 4 protein [Ignavibacteria bacterium]
MNGCKNILIISSEFPPGPGGIGNHAFNLAKYLSINNIDVKVLTVSDFADDTEAMDFDAKQNFEIERFKRYGSRIKTYLKRINQVLNEAKDNNYSHIIFSGRFSLMASVRLKKNDNKTKFISIVHGGDINTNNRVEQFFINKALRKADLLIPVSNYSKSKIKIKLNPDKITVIPNGFDIEENNDLKNKEKILSNGTLNLVSVGTVWPRKGHHNVFNALEEIILDHPETRYNIIGRPADLSRVQKYFDDSKFKDHFKLYGQVTDKEKFEVLYKSQIFILLSESQSSGDFEGFGIAVIEANYFGLPAIGSRGSGLEDSIKDGFSGILVDPRNTKQIRDAVNTITKNYTAFSKAARQWAEQHHWSKIIKKYITAMEGIN